MISNFERILLAALDKLQQTLNLIEGTTIGANAEITTGNNQCYPWLET
jgi:hypothetical protein